MVLHDDSFRRLLRARDAIHARYAQSLRLEDLAREAALSPFHFLRLFRSAFGETPGSAWCSGRGRVPLQLAPGRVGFMKTSGLFPPRRRCPT